MAVNRYCAGGSGIRHLIVDGLYLPQIGEDRLQVVVGHLADERPRHGRKDLPPLPLMAAGPQRPEELIFGEVAQPPGFRVGRQVRRKAHAPRPRPGGQRRPKASHPWPRRGSRRRDNHVLRMAGQRARHVRLRTVRCHDERRVTVVAEPGSHEILAAFHLFAFLRCLSPQHSRSEQRGGQYPWQCTFHCVGPFSGRWMDGETGSLAAIQRASRSTACRSTSSVPSGGICSGG